MVEVIVRMVRRPERRMSGRLVEGLRSPGPQVAPAIAQLALAVTIVQQSATGKFRFRVRVAVSAREPPKGH